MPSTSLRARKGVAIGASGALIAGAALAMTAATTTSAGAAKVDKDFAYKCSGVKPIETEPYNVPINTKLKLPKSAVVGGKVAKRPATLTITMPDALRDLVTSVLQATEAEGGSDNAALAVAFGKKKVKAPINKLAAPRAPIPTDEPWIIATKGTVKAFKVPATAKGGSKAKVSMPKAFTVNATLYNAEGEATDAVLECKAPKKRTLGSIAIKKAPSKLKANVKPKKIVAKKTRAKVNVRVLSKGKATGKVRVMEGKKTLGAAAVKKGKATVTLKKFAKPGKHKLTVKYAGNKSVKASAKKLTVKVVRK